MKKAMLLLIYSNILLCLFASLARAQDQAKDTIYITSADIRKMIDDKYYVRVPSSDLEQRLQDKVTNVVNNKFNIIYGLIGVISLAIGSILLYNLRSVVGARIDKELKENHLPDLNARLNNHIVDMKESIKNNFDDLDKEINLKIENYFLKNFKVNMDGAVAELKQEQQKALHAQEEFSQKSVEMLKVFNEMRLEKLRQNVESRQDLQKTWDGLKDLLTQADKNNDVDMIPRILNEQSYLSLYINKASDFEKIIDGYVDRTDIDINETSLVNAAVGILYDYKATGEATERKKTLKYLNKALRKVPDYGEALGLKLELYMTDYDNEVDNTRKDLAKRESEKLIDLITSKEISAYETILRFRRVQGSSKKSQYIDLAYSIFPDKMKKMEEIADSYKTK